jgi:hypothetical protein
MAKKMRTTKAAMIAELTPLIEGLEAEGKKNMATMSPLTVAMLAAKLKRLLEKWRPSERQPARDRAKRSTSKRPRRVNQCLGL